MNHKENYYVERKLTMRVNLWWKENHLVIPKGSYVKLLHDPIPITPQLWEYGVEFDGVTGTVTEVDFPFKKMRDMTHLKNGKLYRVKLRYSWEQLCLWDKSGQPKKLMTMVTPEDVIMIIGPSPTVAYLYKVIVRDLIGWIFMVSDGFMVSAGFDLEPIEESPEKSLFELTEKPEVENVEDDNW